jgi:hypothetical protein
MEIRSLLAEPWMWSLAIAGRHPLSSDAFDDLLDVWPVTLRPQTRA